MNPANTALAQARALVVARVLVGVYLLEILLNLVRPRVLAHEATLTIFTTPDDTTAPVHNLFKLPATIFWIEVAGIVVGLVLQIVAVRFPASSREARLLTWATLALLLLPFALLPLYFAGRAPLVVLACVPTTVVALVVLHVVQPFGRLPVRMILLALAWGALITSGFFRACGNLMLGTAGGFFLKDQIQHPTAGLGSNLGSFTNASAHMLDVVVITGSLVMAVAQAGGILVLLLLVPRRLRDLTSGTILGAAAGLGFALGDSIVFIKLMPIIGFATGASTGFEYWILQILNLFAGSLAFGAVLGGALALAIERPERRQQLLIGGAGVAAAAGGWAASQTLTPWLQYQLGGTIDQGSGLDTLIVSPLAVLLFQVLFVIAYLLLLRAGARERSARVQAALAGWAGWAGDETKDETIRPLEARVLGDPALRFAALVTTFRRLGRPAAVALYRLQEAQLALATQRADPEPDPLEEEPLQEKVFRLKESLREDNRAVRP